MPAGRYDQQVTIKRPTVTAQNSYGADTAGTPTTVLTCWASVEYLAGRELAATAQRWAEARYSIAIRRQPGAEIRTTDYIEWNGQTLDILETRGQGTRAAEWTITAKDHL